MNKFIYMLLFVSCQTNNGVSDTAKMCTNQDNKISSLSKLCSINIEQNIDKSPLGFKQDKPVYCFLENQNFHFFIDKRIFFENEEAEGINGAELKIVQERTDSNTYSFYFKHDMFITNNLIYKKYFVDSLGQQLIQLGILGKKEKLIFKKGFPLCDVTLNYVKYSYNKNEYTLMGYLYFQNSWPRQFKYNFNNNELTIED